MDPPPTFTYSRVLSHSAIHRFNHINGVIIGVGHCVADYGAVGASQPHEKHVPPAISMIFATTKIARRLSTRRYSWSNQG